MKQKEYERYTEEDIKMELFSFYETDDLKDKEKK